MDKILTVFTPSYNRKHTINRTYESLCRQTCMGFNWLIIDDGSSDGTREWVESLGEKVVTKGAVFDWMGRKLSSEGDNHFVIESLGDSPMCIEYVYKPNGGLYTGYNVAYALIETELCVCIDSDDYAPDDLVEKIAKRWNSRDKKIDYCGIVGLDYNIVDKKPIGGKFAEGIFSGYYFDVKNGGDTKEVLRTDLLRTVSPMIGFEGEKDFNPFYMTSQVLDKYLILVENTIFCWVEYQIGLDSVSQAIFKQYKRSPKSYVKYRLNEMKLNRYCNIKDRIRICVHYVSACIFAKDVDWLKKSPLKIITLLSLPIGIVLNFYVRYKAK